MCDEKYAPYLSDVPGIHDIVIVPDNVDHIRASMRKVEIYKYSKLDQYEKVLYLDCDIILLKDVEQCVFPLIQELGRLHVCKEHETFSHHKHLFWGFEDYTEEQLAEFEERNQHVFNAGQFGFRVCEEIKAHFKNIHDMIESKVRPNFFYEQSFLNWYFNSRFLTVENLQDVVLLLANFKKVDRETVCIVHYALAGIHYQQKLQGLLQYWMLRQGA